MTLPATASSRRWLLRSGSQSSTPGDLDLVTTTHLEITHQLNTIQPHTHLCWSSLMLLCT